MRLIDSIHRLKTRSKLVLGGTLVGLGLLGLTSGPLFVQAQELPSSNGPTHEQMHQMMDTMHGEGTSQRMHEAMGPEGEELMDQCVAMMGMMQNMGGMMSGGSMSGMMGGPSMRDMMQRMSGQ